MLADCPARPSRRDHPMSMAERRARNRSLSSLLCTPPSYPGYSSFLGSISRPQPGRTALFVPYGETHGTIVTSSCGPFSACTSQPYRPTYTMATSTPPIVSPEDDSEFQSDTENAAGKISAQNASASSGYGSAGSESDQDILDQSLMSQSTTSEVEYRSRASKYRNRDEREADKLRRRSVPASLARTVLPDDVITVLKDDGHFRYETDVDSGCVVGMDCGRFRCEESVMQLARRYGELAASQQNDLHKSRSSLYEGKENLKKPATSGPTTPSKNGSNNCLGGIASLRGLPPKMSRPNMFKQMEKVGTGNAAVARPPMNPNSIKEALLRWIQSRVQGYPNVNVSNFSSSWADGMAFCALIHRFAPNAFDFNKLDPRNRKHNFELAFKVAEDYGICPLLEVDDMIMMGDRPDWKCVFTYVQCFYKQFRDHP